MIVPPGRYRLTRTIYAWPAVRVIGYGQTRPVLVLADNRSGYQQGLAYKFQFAGGKPRKKPRIDFATGRPAKPIEGTVPPDASIQDANERSRLILQAAEVRLAPGSQVRHSKNIELNCV